MRSELPDECFEYGGFRIPLRLIPLAGGTADGFQPDSELHIEVVQRLIDIRPDTSVLEIGCGLSRDAIPLTKILGPAGSYIGVDIQRELIDWSVANVTARCPNFRFFHVDIREPWFNPNGALMAQDYKIPAGDSTIDLVILQSVFTHMLPCDVRHYLSEFKRVLRPNGRVFATVFLLDDEILARQDPQSFLSFHHLFDAGCYLHDLAHPTQVVGYRFEALNRLVLESGLEFAIPPLRGMWSGRASFTPLGGQDNIVLRSPAVGTASR
jgi:SAM-dependent methyltransferase